MKGPPFATRASLGTGALTDRLVNRWAPDGGGLAARPGGGLWSLSRADRIIAPLLGASTLPRSGSLLSGGSGVGLSGLKPGTGAARRERQVPDDFDADIAGSSGQSSWVFPIPWYLDELDWDLAEDSPPARGTARALSRIAPAAGPSIGAAGPSVGPSRASGAGREWSPGISAPAARAAELLQAARAGSARETLDTDALVPDFTYVTATDLAESIERRRAVPSRRVASTRQPLTEPSATPAAPAASAATPPKPGGPPEAASHVEPAPAAQLPARYRDASDAAGPGDDASRVEDAPSAAAAPAAAALSIPAQNLAPAAGPRVRLAAGLGGVARALAETRAMTRRPSPRTRTLASSGYAAAAPRALSHMSWADRWLGRLAGAAPTAWDGVALPSPALALAERPGFSDEMTVIAPGDEGPAPALRPERQSAPAPLVIDDDEPTTDDMFAQIAAAAGRDRARAPGTARSTSTRPGAPARAASTGPRAAGPRMAPADRLLSTVSPSFLEPGLRPALAASPAAPALRATLGVEPAPAFDPRGLEPRRGPLAVYRAMIQSAVASRFADAGTAPFAEPTVSRVDERAPELSWVSAWSADEPGAAMAPSRALHSLARRAAGARDQLVSAHPTSPGDAGASSAPDVSGSAAAAASLAVPSPRAVPAMATALGFGPGAAAEAASRFSGERRDVASAIADDFISPEMVLAARDVGLTPLDALRASRLAARGPGAITAAAGDIDLALLQLADPDPQSADDGPARASVARPADPAAAPGLPAAAAGEAVAMPGAPLGAIRRASRFPRPSMPMVQLPAPVAPHAPAGVAPHAPARTLPRGAFVWPAAAARSLGLRAAAADLEQPYARAAIDVMAAATVLELGPDPSAPARLQPGAAAPLTSVVEAESPQERPGDAADRPERAPDLELISPDAMSQAGVDTGDAVKGPRASEPVSGGAPLAVRAAQAMAEAHRRAEISGAPSTVRARAQEAYARLPSPVMSPLVPPPRPARGDASAGRTRSGEIPVGGEAKAGSSAAGPGTRAARPGAASPPLLHLISGRGEDPARPSKAGVGGPGLHPSSAQGERVATAGQHLRSLVAAGPAALPGAQAAQRREGPIRDLISKPATGSDARVITEAVMKATKTDSLPPWFEEAARKILASDGGGAEISFEELVLISTGPREAVAASEQGATDSAAPDEGTAGTGASHGAPRAPDVEVLAREVYELVLTMLDTARERIGDPWEKI